MAGRGGHDDVGAADVVQQRLERVGDDELDAHRGREVQAEVGVGHQLVDERARRSSSPRRTRRARRRRCARFARRPVLRSSSTTTARRVLAATSTRWDPMNPAPPVTRTRVAAPIRAAARDPSCAITRKGSGGPGTSRLWLRGARGRPDGYRAARKPGKERQSSAPARHRRRRASSARTSSSGSLATGTTSACSTTSPPAGAEPRRRSATTIELVEGDIAELRARPQRRARLRGRLPPGRAAVGAALGRRIR